MKTEYSFQEEIILLYNCIKDNLTHTFKTRDDLVDLLKKYNIRIFGEKSQYMITEKHRNNVISLFYSFDDIEINFICSNFKIFKDILQTNYDLLTKRI